jgi:hypothetical protein
LPELLGPRAGIDRDVNIEYSRNNPRYVYFNNRNRPVECERCHCIRDVAADAGKLLQRFRISRQIATVLPNDNLCGGMKISRSAVIAESLPGVQHFVLRCGGESGKVWEPIQPAIIIRTHGADLGLLKHDLGNEDGVGITGSAPRKIAAVFRVPTQQVVTEFLDVAG